jgi:hypothetical protein
MQRIGQNWHHTSPYPLQPTRVIMGVGWTPSYFEYLNENGHLGRLPIFKYEKKEL